MKAFFTTAFIALVVTLHAQTAPRPSTLSVDLKTITSSSKQNNTFSDGAGGHDTYSSRERVIHVRLEAVGGTEIKSHVTVYWVGKMTEGNDRRTLKTTETDQSRQTHRTYRMERILWASPWA